MSTSSTHEVTGECRHGRRHRRCFAPLVVAVTAGALALGGCSSATTPPPPGPAPVTAAPTSPPTQTNTGKPKQPTDPDYLTAAPAAMRVSGRRRPDAAILAGRRATTGLRADRRRLLPHPARRRPGRDAVVSSHWVRTGLPAGRGRAGGRRPGDQRPAHQLPRDPPAGQPSGVSGAAEPARGVSHRFVRP